MIYFQLLETSRRFLKQLGQDDCYSFATTCNNFWVLFKGKREELITFLCKELSSNQ